MIPRPRLTVRRYIGAVLWALDALAAALKGCPPGMLLSADFADQRGVEHWFCVAVDYIALRWFRQPHHCQTALDNYRLRNSVAPFEG